MRRAAWEVVLMLVVVATGNFVPSSGAALAQISDHVLIKFKPSIRDNIKAGTVDQGLGELLNALDLPSGAKLSEPAIHEVLRQQQPAVRAALNLDRFLYLRVPAGISVDECLRRVERHPWVEYAEADGVGTGGVIPNDPNFSNQWHHRNAAKPSACIQTPLAWDLTQGSSNVVVAVLDTGLGVSAEFTGRTVPGYNFAYTNSNTADDYGHGTAVAGVLAANANNSTLVAGVDWRCQLMPVKVLDANNSGLYSWWAQGIDFAVTSGAKIINLSAGGGSSNTTLRRAITNAIAQGVIFVTITHNDGTNIVRFPGNMPECITVGATDPQDRRAGFSNYGPQIDLCAPGTNIYTASRTGTLQTWWGTSFSAPLVSGVCGLLASFRPTLSHDEARLLLCAGAEDGVGDATDAPGFDNYYGWGRLNAYNSLLLARTKVDRVDRTGRLVRLSWTSPANASNKQPYEIQFKDTLSSAWTTATDTASFSYGTNRTSWSHTNAVGRARFYRVRLRQLP